MTEEDRTYTEEEFASVARRAAAAEARDPPKPAAYLSLDDMKEIAAEAGLDPTLIERAARLLPSEPRGSFLSRLTRRRLSASFPTGLTQESSIHVLRSIRAATGEFGIGEGTSSGLVWKGKYEAMAVMQNEEAGSRVLVSANQSWVLVISGTMGVVAGSILAASLDPNNLGDCLPGIAGGFAVGLSIWTAFSHGVKKRVKLLMDTITRTMAETDKSSE